MFEQHPTYESELTQVSDEGQVNGTSTTAGLETFYRQDCEVLTVIALNESTPTIWRRKEDILLPSPQLIGYAFDPWSIGRTGGDARISQQAWRCGQRLYPRDSEGDAIEP